MDDRTGELMPKKPVDLGDEAAGLEIFTLIDTLMPAATARPDGRKESKPLHTLNLNMFTSLVKKESSRGSIAAFFPGMARTGDVTSSSSSSSLPRGFPL
jgi:hypothetical protein